MLTILKTLLAIVVLIAVLFVASSFWVSRPAFDEQRTTYTPTIADPKDALTFARVSDGLVWVTEHNGDSITGVNLTRLLGEERTRDFLALASDLDSIDLPDPSATAETYPLEALGSPARFSFPYIAAGTNFKEHAEEVYLDDPPFLFPKLAAASSWQDPVPFTRRLDFEAELCMFPLTDINTPGDRPRFGLVLCNDFTDRLKLVVGLKLSEPLGETGFAAGKGCEGCLPTGYLVVIPRSPRFYKSIDLSLYVNDELRQRFSMADVILPIEGIIEQAFSKQNADYDNEGNAVKLLPDGRIPRGTLILTGTAAGVIFKPLNIWNQAFYLQPGDVVRAEASFLGHLESTIVQE